MTPLAFLLTVGVLVIGGAYIGMRRRYVRLQREAFIRSYVFPASLLATLSKQHGQLVEKDYFLVARALRQFFIVRARTGGGFIGMPSRVVDDLWHEFILHTRDYAKFCQKAFGEFFHHVPASATPKGAPLETAMRRTWIHACREENINPAKPTRLPLLFAIDEKLGIADGFRYTTQSMLAAKAAGNSSCGGVACGGDSSDCSSDGGCSGSCGGGCGGD